MAFESIYNCLMGHALLLDSHREELIQKRGFSVEFIKKFRFGSGGQHVLGFESEMMTRLKAGEVSESDLIASGTFIHDGKTLQINPVLIREKNSIKNKDISNILIPYINGSGDVYLVRPHKMGLAGVPIEIYQEANLAANPSEIILTEGEFKAAAGMQYGIPTIAVPGISSFSEKEWPRLLKLLNDRGIKKVVVMFDNDTKDDVNLPGYKDKPYDRYDTQFYAFYMASRIEKEAKDVVIATLPDSWKVNGKIDIDGALGQLKLAGEIKKIIYDALPKNAYLASLDTEARQVVLRKMNQKYHRAKVKKEFNRYVVTRHRGKTSWDEPISNFVMKVLATHETPEGVKREVEFINEFGNRSSGFTIGPPEMGASDTFRTFALSKGDYIWRGTVEDLLTIWQSEFLMMDEGRYIIESDHVGWIEREKLWLFGNVAIKADGTELRPDKNGIFWLDKRGIKPVSLMNTTGKNVCAEGIPYLHTAGIDLLEIRELLSETIGKNEASVLLGWITAMVFMDDIFELYRSFPFLFITGRWQSGKSTIAEWVSNFFGMEEAGKSISQTTAVAIQRSLSYYSCLPVYLDEYRNTKDVRYKDGFLRNVYNRQGAGKGLKESFGLRDAKIRGTLIVAGEETPKDGALQSRCIIVFVSQHNRVKNHFAWFMKNRHLFSGHMYSMLKNKASKTTSFMTELETWKQFFTDNEINDRVALNYATVVAGNTAAFGSDDIEFANWLKKETHDIQSEHAEEQAVAVFLDDLAVLKTRKLVDDNYWSIVGNNIYFYFHGLHQIWAQEFRKTRGEEAFKESSIRAYLREEAGYLDMNSPWRIKGQLKKCMVFNYDKASEEIKNLVEPNI